MRGVLSSHKFIKMSRASVRLNEKTDSQIKSGSAFYERPCTAAIGKREMNQHSNYKITER